MSEGQRGNIVLLVEKDSVRDKLNRQAQELEYSTIECPRIITKGAKPDFYDILTEASKVPVDLTPENSRTLDVLLVDVNHEDFKNGLNRRGSSSKLGHEIANALAFISLLSYRFESEGA